jgi:uncharacterized membrane protein YoaK (UPF0700 family)
LTPERNTSRKRGLALTLAAVAGFADVVGYLTLHHLFTAHMTGNASKLGVALGHGDLASAVPLAVAPLLFVVGIAIGTVLLDDCSRRLVLLLEAALVAAYMAYGSTVIHHGTVRGHSLSGFYVLAVLATVALGMQSAALTEIDDATVRTTYVSGILTHLGQSAVRRLRGAAKKTPQQRLWFLAALWAFYIVGATAGSYALAHLDLWCLAFPLAALLGAAAVSPRARANGRSGRRSRRAVRRPG